jgi:hypothetical protein
VVLSLNVPVATNCCVPGAATIADAGVTVMAVNAPLPTVTSVLGLFMPEAVAVIYAVPDFLPRRTPAERTEAILFFEDFQDTPLKFGITLVFPLPSLNVPVAVSWSTSSHE